MGSVLARLLLDDGKIRLEVTKTDGKSVETKVIVGGPLSDRKGVNVPEVFSQDLNRGFLLLSDQTLRKTLVIGYSALDKHTPVTDAEILRKRRDGWLDKRAGRCDSIHSKMSRRAKSNHMQSFLSVILIFSIKDQCRAGGF